MPASRRGGRFWWAVTHERWGYRVGSHPVGGPCQRCDRPHLLPLPHPTSEACGDPGPLVATVAASIAGNPGSPERVVCVLGWKPGSPERVVCVLGWNGRPLCSWRLQVAAKDTASAILASTASACSSGFMRCRPLADPGVPNRKTKKTGAKCQERSPGDPDIAETGCRAVRPSSLLRAASGRRRRSAGVPAACAADTACPQDDWRDVGGRRGVV